MPLKKTKNSKSNSIFFRIFLTGSLLFLSFPFFAFGAAKSVGVGLEVINNVVEIDISDIVVSDIDTDSAKISWNTDPDSTCELRYGRTLAISDGTFSETTPSASHSHTISDLKQGDRYYYQIHCESSGEEKDSGTFEFDTDFEEPSFSVDVNDSKATFSGTGRDGWTVHIKVTGESNFFKTVDCENDGDWEYETNDLNPGEYYVEIYYENEHGDESPESSKKSFTIEAPEEEIIDDGTIDDTGGTGDTGTGDTGDTGDIGTGDIGTGDTGTGEDTTGGIVTPGTEAPAVGIDKKDKKDWTEVYSEITGALKKIVPGAEKIAEVMTKTFESVKESAKAVERVIAENEAEVTVVSGAGIAAGTVPFLFQLNSLKDVGLLLRSLFSFISGIFINRRKRDWGIIYDSRNGKPIPLAVISIFTEDGRLAEKKISDNMGTYSFLVPSGKYSIKVEKKGYEFTPAGMSSEAYHSNNYAGQMLDVRKDDVIKNDIPMKPQVEAVQKAFLRRKLVDFFMEAIFFGGFALSIISLILKPNVLNTVIFGVYLAGGAIRWFAGASAKWGTVFGKDGVAASFAIIKAFEKDSGKLVARTISDEHGRYYLILGQGSYNLEVSSSILVGQSWTGEIMLRKRSAVKRKIELI